MGDAEIVTLLISKIDDLKDDVKEGLSKLESKIDTNSEKLNSFEIKAETVLAVHDSDIKVLKQKVSDLEGKKSADNWFIKIFNDSALSTWLFRLLLILFLTLFGMKKDNIQTVIDLSKQQTIEKVNTVDKK